MKKLFLLTFLTITISGNSQSKEIYFETGNLASVFEKAKKENKLVFVDAYTTWCGPCKWMAKNVFTDSVAASYFNRNFVNYKLDMEKGEGLDFGKKYNVNCYPNLLFIDANGEMVHRGAGSMATKDFIEFAGQSLNPASNFTAVKKDLEQKGLNDQTIVPYVQLLSGACLDPSQQISTFLTNNKKEDLLKRSNWTLLRDYITDYQNPSIQYFITNLPAFEAKYGKDTVHRKLGQLGMEFFKPLIYAKDFDQSAYDKAKKDFEALKWPNTKAILFNADLELYNYTNKESTLPWLQQISRNTIITMLLL
jgi:thiol-disulfide isomerase/thioredoxin